jgi:NAD(P)-dependent dehydrogenase (short-subunit alcohol dehydrogenase family)
MSEPVMGESVMGEGEFAGSHALITGAGSGIGSAIAMALAAAGAKVSLVGRNPTALQAVSSVIGSGYVVVADVTAEDEIARALDQAILANGPLDILINNAGTVTSTPFTRTSSKTWHDTLAVNLTGVFYGCRHVLGAMMARRRGRIVNIASTAGLKGYPYVAAYCAAKHGVIGLTRALALEAAEHGVTVNAVCPGYTDTPMVARSAERIAAKTGRQVPSVKDSLAQASPLKRLIEPKEVADTVVWLCRPSAAAITGQCIVIGGEVM